MKGAKDNIWIFTFEYAGIVKVGGLGEVPANQAKHLADDYEITVFIPSHGQIKKIENDLKWEKQPFNCVGQIKPSQLGINEPETTYNISFYKSKINNVNIILLHGENPFTNKFLDDKIVYNPDTLSGKICLFSIGMRCYIDFLIDTRREDLPDIIHIHDYHAVIPFIGIKQILAKNGLDVSSLITIHLLTWPRYTIDFYRVCGIDHTPITIHLKEGLKPLILDEFYSICEDITGGYQTPSVEQIGAFISDLVTTVSQSYLKSDIIPNCGKELIEFKSNFIWDGCDWDYDEIFQQVLKIHEREIRETLSISYENNLTLSDMKKYLLTHKISHLDRSPLIQSEKVLKVINEISNGNEFVRNGYIKAFKESGPLVITTGRISPQKGFETIFEAIPKVLKVVPDAKFLFLILPTDYSLNEIKSYAQYVKIYPNNIRIIFGVATDIFHLAHISSDVYCALSRWEPFGIIALEAMSTKLPVIATRVGGFQESIIDIRSFPEIGTGILIEKDNPSQFAEALISLFKLKEICEKVKDKESIYDTENFKIVNQIPDEILKSLVLLDPNYYNKIKENCYKRVEHNFRWSIVSKKLIEFYSIIKSLRS
ncbi:MAG: glycosyltransferase [Promethearchaeota archaeon]|nr:MAG: glycosyltransferase [Candidatus Lokiarchaeota archaeon]